MFSRDYKRAIYNKNPISDVTCELRFPAILKIETETPSQYQELLRHRFSGYEKKLESDFPEQFVQNLPPDIIGKIASVKHVFESNSETEIIKLTSKSFSVTTYDYSTWANFKNVWFDPLRHFIDLYQPAYLSYISLVYRDLICRSELGLPADTPWSQLLNPAIAGELADDNVSETDLLSGWKRMVVRLPDRTGLLGIQHGLATLSESEEVLYAIESTFFTEGKQEVNNAETVLDTFNAKAGSFFRWCISEELHQAMGPENPRS